MSKQWIKTFYNKLIDAEASGSDKEIDLCLEYKKQHLPRFIYKYRNCNKYAYNDLFKNCVHLSYPTAMNDPFDASSFCTYEQILLLSLLEGENSACDEEDELFPDLEDYYWTKEYRELLKRELLKGKSCKSILINHIQETGPFSKWEAQNFYKSFKHDIDSQVLKLSEDYKKEMLLCSFSATVKNNSMWAHYAASHTGFCIEYDLQKLAKNSRLLHALYPVIYSKKPLLSDIQACFYTNAARCMLTVMNKCSDWDWEEEYRLYCSPKIIALGADQDYFMPILPSRIFLGLNIKPRDQEKIVKFAKKHCIEVRKMEINASSFNLSHKRVY